jgi:hypothetical protein
MMGAARIHHPCGAMDLHRAMVGPPAVTVKQNPVGTAA